VQLSARNKPVVVHDAMAQTLTTKITVSAADAPVLANLFSEMLDPAPAVSVSETNGTWFIEAYFSEPPAPEGIAAIAEMFPAYPALAEFRLEAIADEDWVAKVQRGLHPIEAGRFFIHGSHDRAAAKGRTFAIEIEAGQAFGTAHHGTTRGCLLALDELAKRERIESILDLGTGSGVLAIAAAKVMRGEVVATDIDPVAVAVARENIVLNGTTSHIDTFVASGLKHPAIVNRAPYGLIMANILAKPLLTFAPDIMSLFASGGYLILSGMLHHQAREVGARYAAQGLTHIKHIPLDEWTTLVMRAA
jgi:ribosomal protein L11 methyltransferase